MILKKAETQTLHATHTSSSSCRSSKNSCQICQTSVVVTVSCFSCEHSQFCTLIVISLTQARQGNLNIYHMEILIATQTTHYQIRVLCTFRWFSCSFLVSHRSSFILLTHQTSKSNAVKNGVTISHNKSTLHSIYFLWCTFLYE